MKRTEVVYQPAMKWALLVFIAGIACSWLGSEVLEDKRRQALQTQLQTDATRIMQRIQDRLKLYEYGLRGARGAILAARGVQQESGELADTGYESFARYSRSRDLEQEFPGANGFGFIRKVPAKDADIYVDAVRAQGQPDFSLSELSPNSGDRYVIEYIFPEARNRQAIGLDIASEVRRRSAAIEAMRTGTVQITAPINLVQEEGSDVQAFLFLKAIYTKGPTPATEQERLEQGLGWSYAPLILRDLLDSLNLDTHGAQLVLEDLSADSTPLYGDTSVHRNLDSFRSHQTTARVYGRQWRLTLAATDTYTRAFLGAGLHIGYGLGALLSGLLAWLSYLFIVNGARKRRLQSHNRSMAALVNEAPDAIVGMDAAGRVTSWNARAHQLFGYLAHEVNGRRAIDIFVPPEEQPAEYDRLESLTKGKHVASYESRRLHKDGSSIDVHVSVAPIRNELNQVVGFSETLRDIGLEKRARAEIQKAYASLESQVAARTSALKDNERLLQVVLNAVPTQISYWYPDLMFRVGNQAFLEATNQTSQELEGRRLPEINPNNIMGACQKQFEAARDGVPQKIEREIIDVHGQRQFYQTHIVPDQREGHTAGILLMEFDISEITENRIHLAEALHENEVLLSTIDEQLQLSITDAQGRIVAANDNFCHASGYSENELIGQDHRILNSGTHTEDFFAGLWEHLKSGQTWRGNICNQTKAGDHYWVDMVVSPFMGTSGKVERFIALSNDVTEQMQADIELKRVNTLLNNVLDAASSTAIIATDVAGKVTIFNRGAELLLGYSPEQMLGKFLPKELVHSDDIALCEQSRLAVDGARVSGFEALVYGAKHHGHEKTEQRLVRKDGSHFEASLTISAIKNLDGRLTGFLGLAADISQQREYERSLKSTRDQFEVAAAVADLGIWTWNLADNSLDWNSRMLQIYGYPLTMEQLEYRHWTDRVHPEDIENAESLLQSAVAGVGEFNPVFRIRRPDGQERIIRAAAHVERTASGEATKVIGINLDVTEQRNFEESLRKAKQQADAANRAKSAFISNMSHEIRTPMNAVLGMMQLLQQTALDDRQNDYLTKAHRSAKSLLHLLNDILDFSKLDARKMKLDIHPFQLEGFLRDLAGMLTGSNNKYDVELIFDVDTALPNMMLGDSMRLQQVLVNLAGNALKFTELGQIVVSVKTLSKSTGSVQVRFSVEDTGIGISEEQQGKIFSGFEQAESSTSRRYGGSGLGLFISKQLVELMGGTLRLESEPGVGSRFWFDLELKTDQQEPIIERLPAQLCGKRVLIVEDNKLTSDILARGLARTDWHIDQVYDGVSAVNAVEAALAREENYDIILMDWRMPSMNGTETAKKIVNLCDAPPMVVMVTAFGHESLESVEERTLFSDFMLKPVTPSQVVEAIVRLLSGEQALSKQPRNQARLLEGSCILLVEDNALNRQVAVEMLKQAGAYVDVAVDGEQALDIIAVKSSYDLVLMDVQMPGMDGYVTTKKIRNIPACRKLPIVAMTANVSEQDKDRCLASGMNGHIAKPIDQSELIEQVAKAIKREVTTDVSTPKKENPLEDALVRFGGNTEFYSSILARYPKEAEALIETLARFIKEDDREGVICALHSLKGVSGTVGLKAVAAMCAEHETALRENEKSLGLRELESLIGELRRAVQNDYSELASLLSDDHLQSPAAVETQASVNSDVEWHAGCNVLLVQLAQGDLSALAQVGKLEAVCPEKIKAEFSSLNALVADMEFDKASEKLKRLLEDGTWDQK